MRTLFDKTFEPIDADGNHVSSEEGRTGYEKLVSSQRNICHFHIRVHFKNH